MPAPSSRTLRLFLPRLPRLHAEWKADSWIDELLQVNCGETLGSTIEGTSDRRVLDSCSISREGLSYRLQIKKGCVFADGQEMTAEDLMDSLLRIALQTFHPAGLGRILRFTGPDVGRSFRVLSRYRLEVLLNRAVPDFLERLSHPACFLHKRGQVNLTSGCWQLVAEQPHELQLQSNSRFSPDAMRYERVLIQKLDAALWKNDDFDEAFVAIFPGDTFPSPAGNILNGRSTTITKQNMLRALWLAPHVKQADPSLGQALTDYARQRSLWRKKPLRSLFENQRFQQDLPLMDMAAKPTAGALNVHGLPPEPAPAFLEDLRAFLKSRWSWDLTMQAQQPADAILFSLFEGHAEGGESTLSMAFSCMDQLHRQVYGTALASLKKIVLEDDAFRRQKLIHEQLQKFSHSPALVPLYRTPILIHSNRNLHRENEAAPLLLLHQVGDSLRREQTDELRQASLSALGSAVQMLVHDVKRPFAMLQGVLTLMGSQEDPERIRDLARQWLPEVKRMAHTVQEMISDVLEMASNQEIMTEPLSLLDVVHDALNLLTAASKSVQLRFQPQHALMLEGDRYRLARVIANLLNNAIQATPEHGTITISSREEHAGSRRWLRVRIHNTGSYIPPEKRQRIFEAFFTEGKKQGTGLGLAIAQKVIVSHGGQILCESDEKEGTSFIFTVPASYRIDPKKSLEVRDISQVFHRLPPAPQAEVKQTGGARTLRILLVDDDHLYTSFMRDVWQTQRTAELDLQLFTAEDAHRAAELVKRHVHDLILVDYELGRDDGVALLPMIRQHQPQALIGLHSHHSGIELREAALKAGADVFEPKPLTAQLAQQLLHRVLQRERPATRSRLILVEDDPLYQDMWRDLCPQITCFAFPEQLLEAARQDPDLLASAQALITDGFFVGSEIQGIQLAAQIHAAHPDLPIHLCSQIQDDRSRSSSVFKGFVAKDPESIQTFLNNLQRPSTN
ncbi:ATP-binding response regulator [Oligoflexus tunisiensis]|uniref:ATP-binding response regulator n=1 Tax=Oligoflexus tunisiensis TaxID=708132 RepID=UPI00114CB5AA|nr:hybrid sensor histidine kinase/response regulator [Oligoflexus tunisiensis]